MTYDRSLFSTYSEVQLSPIRIADNSKLRIVGENIVFLPVMIDGKALQVNFLNVFNSPDLEYNLLSVGIIEESGYSVLLKNRKLTVFDNENSVSLVERQIETSYMVDRPFDETYQALSSFYSLSQNHDSWTEWHWRLGNFNIQDVKKPARMSLVIDA